jgi:hypothetical protein
LKEDQGLTPDGRIKKPNVTVLLHSIIASWQYISPEVLMKGRKMCCVFNSLGGTDDNMLWSFSEEDGNVRSECEKMKVLTVKM